MLTLLSATASWIQSNGNIVEFIGGVIIILTALASVVRWGIERRRNPKLVITSPFYAKMGEAIPSQTKVEHNPNGTTEFSSTLLVLVTNVHKKTAEKSRADVETKFLSCRQFHAT